MPALLAGWVHRRSFGKGLNGRRVGRPVLSRGCRIRQVWQERIGAAVKVAFSSVSLGGVVVVATLVVLELLIQFVLQGLRNISSPSITLDIPL